MRNYPHDFSEVNANFPGKNNEPSGDYRSNAEGVTHTCWVCESSENTVPFRDGYVCRCCIDKLMTKG